MKTYIILLSILMALPVQAENVKPSKPIAGQNSGNTSSSKQQNTNVTNTYNSNQNLINSFAGDTSVMP